MRSSGFCEVYKNWANFGLGTMLCYINNKSCVFVKFESKNSKEVKILDTELLKMYYKE